MSSWRRRGIVFLTLIVGVITGLQSLPQEQLLAVRPRVDADWQIEDLVAVTEDIATSIDGCDAISVFSIRSGEALARGPTNDSVSRLAGNSDLSLLLAMPRGRYDGFLYGMLRGPKPDESWRAQPQMNGLWATSLGGIAIMPDGDTVLAAENGGPQMALGPPYWVGKYLASEMGTDRVGADHGRFSLQDLAAEILSAPDGATAHIVTRDALVETIDPATMTQVSAPIRLKPIGEATSWQGLPIPTYGFLALTHAAVTGDGHYLFTNRWDKPELNVADLVERRAWTVSTGNPLNGGVAVNRGWVNAGLVAVHAVDYVVVYRFDSPMSLVRLGSMPVDPPRSVPGANGPVPSIAWSGSGSHLIAATDSGPAEFVVIEVTDGGRTLVPTSKFEACPVKPNGMGRYSHLPNDIVTANGLLTPVVPTATASPTEAETETPAPTMTTTPSNTPSPTTVPPQAVFLPILLRAACSGGTTQMDVALVIDMSTSMRRLTATGRPKYVAAIEAAVQFVDRLQSTAAGAGRNRVAVIGFNSDAWRQEGLTTDRAALVDALQRLVGRIQEGSRLDLALSEVRVTLKDAPVQSRKVGILLTDGLPNGVPPAEDGRQETTILRIADTMKVSGMTLFGVGLGEPADLDEPLLIAVASGEHHYWHAKDGEDLVSIYAAMAEIIDCPR